MGTPMQSQAEVLRYATPSSATLDDAELVVRLLGGETALFEVVMRRHNQRLFRVMRAVLRDDADAEDALQLAWLSVYRHLAQFQGEARFTTWLTRIALNQALDLRRGRRRRAEVDLAEVEPSSIDARYAMADAVSPEHHASLREQVARIEQAIDALPEPFRVVLTLRLVEEMSTLDVAGALDVSEEVVKVRLHRARARLREALGEGLEAAAGGSFAFHLDRCDRVVSAVFAVIAPALRPR